MYNMAGRLVRGSMRGQPPLSRPHPIKIARARRFHATATRLTSTIPPFAEAFQAKGVYTDRFPCTLHYYSSRGPKLALFDYTKLSSYSTEQYDDLESCPYYLHEDSVCVGDNGLVDPSDRSQRNFNGLNMWPNTLLMLQITRSYSEAAEDFRNGGENVPVPWIFTVHKGTPLPRNLFLVYQELDKFWLLPREATTLSALNEDIKEFFGSQGTQMPEGEWGAKYFIEGYNTGSEEHQWMSR